MNYWISVLILAIIYFFVIFKIPEWIKESKKKSLVYEVKQPGELPKHHCPKCNHILIRLPPNPKGEFQCLHCQTYYNLKSGGSECKTSAAPSVTKN